MSAQQELRSLIDVVEEKGFDVELGASGHYKVFWQGHPVNERRPDGSAGPPLTFPSTPSDSRWRQNLVATLIRSSVLDDDPQKEGQRPLSDEDRERREAERLEREARQAEAGEARAAQSQSDSAEAAETRAVRDRAERVLGQLGVWKLGGRGGSPKYAKRSVQEAGRVAWAWSEENDLPRPGMTTAPEIFRRLYDGELLSPDDRAFVSAFVATVEASSDPVEFYFGLLRDLLGLTRSGNGDAAPVEPAPRTAPEPGPEPLATEDEDDLRVRSLREALDEARRESDARAERLRQAEEALSAQEATLAEALAEARELADAVVQNGGPPKVPELAFEVLGEMLGQYVTVAADDGGGANLDDVMKLIDEKRQKAVVLAKRVAALEVGAEVEA